MRSMQSIIRKTLPQAFLLLGFLLTSAPVALSRGDSIGSAGPIQAVGSFRARQISKLGPQVSGRVQDVLVDIGDRVKKGQKLLLIDPVFFQIELKQRQAELSTAQARLESSRLGIQTAEADVAVAKAAMADADLQYQRMKSLWDKPDGESPSIPKRSYDEALFGQQQASARVLASQSRLGEARARVAEAQASVILAEQAVRWAEQRLAETSILAPYDGVITNRMVDPGEPVVATPITEVLELQEISRMNLEFSLPQAMLSRVQVGTPVEFTVEGVRNGTGTSKIELIYPGMDEVTRSFRCRAFIDNKERGFVPGQLVSVKVLPPDVQP